MAIQVLGLTALRRSRSPSVALQPTLSVYDTRSTSALSLLRLLTDTLETLLEIPHSLYSVTNIT